MNETHPLVFVNFRFMFCRCLERVYFSLSLSLSGDICCSVQARHFPFASLTRVLPQEYYFCLCGHLGVSELQATLDASDLFKGPEEVLMFSSHAQLTDSVARYIL